jgi:hypothetical protein
MSILNTTPPERMTDAKSRPYFLWDMEMSLEEFTRALHHDDPDVRAYFLGKLMRQAKPDDVFAFVSVAEIRDVWPTVRKYLGRSAAFWSWLLETWEG